MPRITISEESGERLQQYASRKHISIKRAVAELINLEARCSLSPLASQIYNHIRSSTSTEVTEIARILKISFSASYCGSGKWTEGDTAMQELTVKGLIEEISRCRYQLRKP